MHRQTRHYRVRVNSSVRIIPLLTIGICRNERAVGVEFVALNDEGSRTVRARRLVVVAAGALGSPSILERSGIGAKRVLEAAGVEQVVDLPGVGENYNGDLTSSLS